MEHMNLAPMVVVYQRKAPSARSADSQSVGRMSQIQEDLGPRNTRFVGTANYHDRAEPVEQGIRRLRSGLGTYRAVAPASHRRPNQGAHSKEGRRGRAKLRGPRRPPQARRRREGDRMVDLLVEFVLCANRGIPARSS